MKKLILIAMAIGLVACNPEPEKVSDGGISNARVVRGGAPVTPAVVGTQVVAATPSFPKGVYQKNVWGQVIVQDKYENDFQMAVKAFVSGTMDPQYLGHVPSQSNSRGMIFNGYVGINGNGTLDKENSQFILFITDEYTGKIDDTTKQEIPPYYVQFKGLSNGAISGNQVDLIFKDEVGQIRLVGEVAGGVFYGGFYFTNFKSWDNKTPQNGVIGEFNVDVCGFFSCKQ